MAGFEGLHVTEQVGEALARLGYSESDPYLNAVVPPAARGNNLVVVTPPAAVHALPGLAGVTSALIQRGSGILLILVPEAALLEWESVVSLLARETAQTVHAVRSLARATRLLQTGSIHILIAPPAAALALAQRSTLKIDQIAGLFMAWPEFWSGDDAVTPLMQDLGRDVPRTIYTTAQERVADLVERHARRAHTVGPALSEMPGAAAAAPKPVGSVRLVSIAWNQRAQALKEVVELLDPPSSAAWTLTRAAELAPDLPPGTELVVREVPHASLTIAYDLPNAAQLSQLLTAGDVVVLVPPTGLAWLKRVVPTARLLRLPGAFDTAAQETRVRRDSIAQVIDHQSIEGALLALSPLFERYDPASVAAATYQLWQERPETTAASGAPAAPPASMAADVLSAATARIWLGVGKKDSATANDFVGVLTKELHFDRSRIGKIEVRELYSLVEVPASEAEGLVAKLNGVTIRRRRITARIDRGGKVRSDK